MAKNLLFALLLCTLPFAFTQLFASNERTPFENKAIKLEQCDAPPPDSFHVTSAGAHFASLAWQPEWVGALHTLTVLKKNANTNAWEPVDTFQNVPASSYTVSNLQYGSKYGFLIATNCISGEPSKETSFTEPPIGLILDLVLLGRTPTNPKEVPSCIIPIPYENFNWVGFRVGNELGLNTAFNFFEFGVDDVGIPVIKRVEYGPVIVAAELATNKFPTQQNKKIELWESRFQIYRYISEDSRIPIGVLDLTFDDQNKTVKICQSMGDPWNPSFTFKLLTAQSASGLRPSRGGDRFNDKLAADLKVKAQTPFNDVLNIFLPQNYPRESSATFKLLNANGQTVIEKHFYEISNQVSLPVESLSAGLYILRLETEGETQTLKVVKSE